MAGRFACEHPKRIAALAQVVGTAAADVAATRRPTVPVPIISIHATADRYAPYVGRRANDVLARLLAPADAGSTTGSGWT